MVRTSMQTGGSRRRQSGAALLVFTALLVLISTSVLLDRLQSRSRLSAALVTAQADALAEAKQALIAYAVTDPNRPGELPCPDVDYDGSLTLGADFGGGGACTSLRGWLPWRTLGIGELRDAANERIWYALDGNYRAGAAAALNPGTAGALSVDATANLVAVLIAPGEVFSNAPNQEGRPAETAGGRDATTEMGLYLEGVNADADLTTYTAQGGGNFNDRVMFLGQPELMRKVEQRVLGDAAVALGTYTSPPATGYGRFPWLSPFRDPTSATGAQTLTGRADAGTGGLNLIDAGVGPQDFVTAGVQPGDIVTNVTRRTTWVVNAVVSPTQLTLTAASDFDPNDAYNVRPAFNGIWGQREGHIPFDDNSVPETNAVPTGFTLTWSNGTTAAPPPCAPLGFPWWLTLSGLGCTQLQNSYQNGTFTQPQPVVPTPAADNGECIWTNINTVDCWCDESTCTGGGGNTETRNPAYNIEVCILGCGFLRFTTGVVRTYTYTFSYTGAGAAATGSNNVKTRTVTNTGLATIVMSDTVLGISLWNGTVTMNPGDYVMSDIYFDIEDGIEFPGYFFTNLWHQFVYVKISDEHVAINSGGGASSGNCTGGADCVNLQVGAATLRNDIQGVLAGAGTQLAGQNRAIGNQNDYFENNNATPANDIAERGAFSAAFNDQVRVIQPNPP